MGNGKRLVVGAVAVIGTAMLAPSAFAGNAASAPALYTKSQARRGAMLYRDNCASCHATDLKGNVGPALVGRQFRQMAAAQDLTAKSLLEVTSQSMPKTNPGGLKPAEYDAIIAFVLQKNGYPAGKTKLTAGESGLSALKLAK